MNAQAIWSLLKETFTQWNEDKAPRLGAALAYYTIFSLAPLLVIAIAVAGFFFSEAAAANELINQVEQLAGPEVAGTVGLMIENASRPGAGIVATVVGIVALLFGASGVFGQLQDALNTIWNVEPKQGRGIGGFIKDRFLSFAMVLGVGFLLLVSLVLNTFLATLGNWFQAALPGGGLVWGVVNFVIALAVTTLIFALIFRVLPDVEIAWGDVWIGALATAVLFSIGRELIGRYLATAGATSVYGAAGSLVIVLIWVYYSALILFLGAEFTQVYANRYGSRLKPADGAQPLSAEERRQQGLPPQEQPSRAGQAPAGAGDGDAPPALRRSPGALAGLLVGFLLGTRRRNRK